MSTNKEVAETILAQLGGSRFRLMTGARHFVGAPSSLAFRIPRSNGISQVKVTLTGMDDYIVAFVGMHAGRLAVKARHDGIYCDQLQELFTRETGLDTRLATVEGR